MRGLTSQDVIKLGALTKPKVSHETPEAHMQSKILQAAQAWTEPSSDAIKDFAENVSSVNLRVLPFLQQNKPAGPTMHSVPAK